MYLKMKPLEGRWCGSVSRWDNWWCAPPFNPFLPLHAMPAPHYISQVDAEKTGETRGARVLPATKLMHHVLLIDRQIVTMI